MHRSLRISNQGFYVIEPAGIGKDWFTEGFDTADLKEAKALLDVLKGSNFEVGL